MTVQKIENKDLKTDVEVGKQTNAIDEAVTSRNLVETKKVDQTFDTITAKADAKVAQIKRDQQAARVAPASAGATVQAPPAASPPPTVEENQVSTVRVNELWESYCAAAPDASECKKEQ